MKPTPKWTNLGEVVYDMVEQKRTNTPEFQNLCKYWTKEKLRALYLEEKVKRYEKAQGLAKAADSGRTEQPKQREFLTDSREEEPEDPWEEIGYKKA